MSALLKPVAKHSPLEKLAGFRRALLSWFGEVGKSYPWRETRDAYAVLVSEVMLQQTQIATVLEGGYFQRWMARFPDVLTLAQAPEEVVLRAWEGLGYYRRARALHRLAQVVCAEHDGRLPDTVEGILALPGIGRYTAGAVLSFAYDQPRAVVDGNVVRVLARLFDYAGETDSKAGEQQLWAWAEALLPRKSSRAFNSGLMELGQICCRQRRPDCLSCPVSAYCQTRSPEALPNKKPRRATVYLEEEAIFQVASGRLALVQERGKRRRGLWKLPECPQDQSGDLPLVYEANYSITHHRVTMRVYASRDIPVPDGRWFALADLTDLPMPSPYRKAVDRLLGELYGV